ncbi:MAG: serine/threonine-protein kinase [Rubripirellula sp.]|nr:serine/threonine-protein kinase [Rubripirellula sp.]
MSESPQTNDPLDEAFAAYLRSCDAGEIRSREDFLAQFPELAGELKQLMEAADMLGTFTEQKTASHVIDPEGNPSDTIATNAIDHSDPDFDPEVTLPIATRQKGDPGPTLPYDLGGNYLLQEELGRGGMGVVYLAKQRELDRFVAVKMIRSGMLAGNNEVRRFYIEAQATARLSHPGIVGIHHFGQHEGHHFFSMEYIEGTDLQRKINTETLSPKQAARYVRDVARAIHHAHQKGVLHRDLKPANVLIDEQDCVRVTDFGLAKHIDTESSVTGSGAAVGTPHYMAPEQASGHSERVCRQSDVYSLGSILFASVTGRPPIMADTVMQTLVQVIHDPAPSVRSIGTEIPADLETIIAKCLEKPVGKRYKSAEALADELDAFLEGRPIKARPRSRIVKAWHWIEGVPLVAGLMGHRILHASPAHRRFQNAMLLLILLLTPILIAGAFTFYHFYRNAIPGTVRIYGGPEGGEYNDISVEIGNRIARAHGVEDDFSRSNGSWANHNAIVAGEVDLAPMQATSIRGDELGVVAPLFYELLYVLAREDSDIQTMQDLKNCRIAIGPPQSGSYATAMLVLKSLNLLESNQLEEGEWEPLAERKTQLPDAAMICIARNSDLIAKFRNSGRWRIIPIRNGAKISDRHPTLRSQEIQTSEFFDESPTTASIPTIGTTAFLVSSKGASSKLVRASLEALYSDPPLREDLISKSLAIELLGFVAFHPEAQRYFTELLQENRKSVE